MEQPRRSADPTGWQSRPDTTAAFPAVNGQPVALEAPPVPAPVDDPDADLDLMAEVSRRPSRTTVLLLAGILASVAFVGGAVVQKHYGDSSTGGAPGAAAGGFGGRTGGTAGGYGGFGGGAGGFPGGGQAGGGQAGGGQVGGAAPGAAAGDTAGGATGGTTSGGTTSTSPVVVGTVSKMSGSSLTVKNLGGKSVNVKVPEGATITLVAGKSLTTLKKGATVSVAGTKAADGTVTATSITVRS